MKVYTPEISWHERDPIYTCAFNPINQNKFCTAGVTGEIRLWELDPKAGEKKQKQKEREDQQKKSKPDTKLEEEVVKPTTSTSTNKLLSKKEKQLEKMEKEKQSKENAFMLNNGTQVKFISNMKRHTKSVNVVRWNHEGKVLASAGDEAVVFLWQENDVKNQRTLDSDEFENIENWFSFKTFRGHLEDILDIAWSSDSTTLVSGSIDNSVIVWNVASGAKLALLKEPKGFVQGVCFDPLGATFAALSTDKCLRIFSNTTHKCIMNVNKIKIPPMTKENKEKEKDTTTTTTSSTDDAAVVAVTVAVDEKPTIPNLRLFHDDSMKSFFRRMSYSPDGSFLFAPAGCLEIDEKQINTSYIFTRNNYARPVLYLPHDRPSVAIAVLPLRLELIKKAGKTTTTSGTTEKEKSNLLFNLPYRYVFAIATEDSVFLYDTQSVQPFAYVAGIHYSNLSDLSWSPDGRILIVSSIDGFSTFVVFDENELGFKYVEPVPIDESSSATESMEVTGGSAGKNEAMVAETITTKQEVQAV